MATYAGYGGAVFVDTTAVAEVKDFTLDITANTADTTVLNTSGADAGWTDVGLTTKTWTASINVIWDDTDSNQAELSLVDGGTVAVKLYPAGTTSGKHEWSGNCMVTSVSRSVAVDGLVESAITVTGKGAITFGTVS
nr:phage major tail protein 2 [uncultured Mediterranean phage uvMED]